MNERDARFAEIGRALREHNKFAVLSHVRPDGDALGSTLALALSLKELGKDVRWRHIKVRSQSNLPPPQSGGSRFGPRPERYEARDRTAGSRDDDFLSRLHPLDEAREVRFCLVDVDASLAHAATVAG